jgi:hypothetical protein
VLDSVESYNFGSDTWEVKEPMIEARTGHTAVSLPNGIYVIGGFNGTDYLASMEKYDETENRWETMPEMNCPRAKHSSVVSSDC